MAYSINKLTKAEWKKLRNDAKVEKTVWWKGSGPSVGKKLETWQKARANAKDIKPALGDDDYVIGRNDDKIVLAAFNALYDLEKALRLVATKLKATKEGTKELDEFAKAVKELLASAEKKGTNWGKAAEAVRAKSKEDTLKNLNQAFNI